MSAKVGTVGELLERMPAEATDSIKQETDMPDTVMQPEQQAAVPSRYQRRSTDFDKLAAALAKAQGAMENAEKGAENLAFKRDGKVSTYATLGNVWEAIRKPLTDNGLSILQWPHTVENGVEIETELLHESGQFMRDVLWLPCPQMTVHAVGSAITYGRRYALMSIVGIAPEDDDGNAATEGHKPGAPGSAGGGNDFRPAGPRRFQGNGSKPAPTGWVKDALDDGLIQNGDTRSRYQQQRDTATNPKVKQAAGALAHMDFIKKSIETIKDATDKASLSQWWRDTKDERDAAEDAVPTEWDRVMTDFDAKMESLS